MKDFENRFIIGPGSKVSLTHFNPGDTSSFDGEKKDALKEIQKLKMKIEKLQVMLYAEHKHAFLIILQAMDAGGKDSTIRLVFDGVNPQGVTVASFKKPTPEEQDHDFLWRIHKQVPSKGEIVIFNRSHYESVLVERVHKLAPKEEEGRRYEEINEFERMLCEEGTIILKFFLHIDYEEQRKRLKDRLDDPTKEWKFSENDLLERKLWSEYMIAYEKALEKTSSDRAPWYVVPSNHKWFRDLIVSRVIVKTLEKLDMRYPRLSKERRSAIEIK
ncbi:MAG: polyphosphate kinase 2 family protein [Nitrososphaerales archaeon]